MVNNAKEMIVLSEKFDVIGIDEIQFFDDSIIDCCISLINKEKIINAGLDMDYQGNRLTNSKTYSYC